MKRVMLKDAINNKWVFLLLFGTLHTYNLYARVYDTIFNTIISRLCDAQKKNLYLDAFLSCTLRTLNSYIFTLIL